MMTLITDADGGDNYSSDDIDDDNDAYDDV